MFVSCTLSQESNLVMKVIQHVNSKRKHSRGFGAHAGM